MTPSAESPQLTDTQRVVCLVFGLSGFPRAGSQCHLSAPTQPAIFRRREPKP